MGSSSNGKKHKKEKKHKHRDVDDDEEFERKHHKHHKKHKKEHKERKRERRVEVIAVEESDSDNSDCVVVDDNVVEKPIALKSTERDYNEVERQAPPPPSFTRQVEQERDHDRDWDREKLKERRAYEKSREYERGRENEKERHREYERDRESEKERQRDYERHKEKERERYERDRDLERRRQRDYEREREKEYERSKERDTDRNRERDRNDKDNHRQRDRQERTEREKEKERFKNKSKSRSPIPENGAGDCLSIEETNKLRAKLGLKPLEINSEPSNSEASVSAATANNSKRMVDGNILTAHKDEWGEFLHKPADNLKEKATAEKLREKLKQSKEKRFLEKRLANIKTLGESDDEVDDVTKWVQRNKTVTDLKKQADMRAKALEDMDAEFGINDLIENEKRAAQRKAYSDLNLKGLRVDHDMEDFSEGRTVILTLKDNDVLNEEEGDTLVNVNMVDNERYRKNVENKKLNPLSYGYDVYQEQYDELGNPIERGVLEKYDDVDGTKKKRNFVIGENMEEAREYQRKLLEIKTKLAGKRLDTLADTRLELASDTLTETEIAKFKKPKKKVKKLRQKLKAEDLLPLADEPIEDHLGNRHGVRVRENENSEVSMQSNDDIKPEIKLEEDDDDYLQRVLSKARKLKQKENVIKKSLPFDSETIKQEIKTEPAMDVDDEEQEDYSNIILNSTAEFCRTLGDIPTYGMAGNRNNTSNDIMDFEEDIKEEYRSTAVRVEEPEVNHGTWNSVNPDEVNQPVDLDDTMDDVEEVAILDEEPDVGAGVANALRLALSKGYLEKEERNRPSNTKMSHLQAKNYSIEDKSAGDEEKFGRQHRFHSGPIMDFKDKDNFKPNVKLEYIDDNGRILNLKEAFRYLSHKFHGKGPGKNKIEKRLKKMEQDGLMKTMSSTDTPLGTLTMLQQKQKETKTPYVVLSGGKQNVNSATLSKYK